MMILMLLLYVFSVLIWCVMLHETVLPHVAATTLFVSLCSGAMVFYATHRLGHEKQAISLWFRAHTHGHHYLAYPSHTPQSDKYVVNLLDIYQLNTFAYVLSGMIHLLSCYLLILRRLDYIVALAGTELVLLYMENYFHREVHKCSSAWQQWAWFRYVRDCHMQHHRFYTVNFAVVALWTDWLFGTLAEPTDKDTDTNMDGRNNNKKNNRGEQSLMGNMPSVVDCS